MQQRSSAEYIISPEGVISTYPLPWQDPAARAAYSSNPLFAEGADQLPVQAGQTLLAQPEIVDALEAVDLITHPSHNGSGERLLVTPEVPLDFELAKRGLKRLKTELGNGPADHDLRLAVSDTKRRLPAYESNRLASPVQTSRPAEVAEATPPQDLQAGYRQELAQAIQAYSETDAESFDYTFLSTLSEELVINESENGLTVRERAKYSQKLARHVEGYLEEPAALLQDLRAGLAIMQFIGGPLGEEAAPRNPAYAMVNAVISSIAHETSVTTYGAKELTAERIAKWMEFGKTLLQGLGGAKVLEKFTGGQGININLENSGEELRGLALLTGQMVITRSLIAIADREPSRLVDSMHLVAEVGLLDQVVKDTVKQASTLSILRICLEDNEVPGLVLALSVGATHHPEIQRKAIDLQMSLSNLGVPHQLVYPGSNLAKNGPVGIYAADRRVRQVLRNLYPSALYDPDPEVVMNHAFQSQVRGWYDGWKEDFVKFARTPEGRATTLFGRLFDTNKIKFESSLTSME